MGLDRYASAVDSIWVHAGLIRTPTANGTARYNGLLLVADTLERVSLRLPQSWAVYRPVIDWINLSTDTGDFNWQWRHREFGPGDTLPTAVTNITQPVSVPAQYVVAQTTMNNVTVGDKTKKLAVEIVRSSAGATFPGASQIMLLGVTLERVS